MKRASRSLIGGLLRQKDTEAKIVTMDSSSRILQEPVEWTSPCQVSNDEPDEFGVLPLQSCDIAEFSCPATNNNNEATPTTLEVTFAYELHYTPGSDLEGVLLPYLQENMISYAAEAMGLSDCDAETTVASRGNGRSLSIESIRFIGISRNPLDQVDSSVQICNQGRPVGGLTLSECAPIQGGVTVTLPDASGSLTEAQLQDVETSVRGFLKDGMDRDVFLARGHIQKLVFAEERSGAITVVDTPIPVTRAAPSPDSGLSSTWSGLIGGIVALLVLIALAWLFLYRRKKQSNGQRSKEVSEDQAGLAAVDSLALAPQGLGERGFDVVDDAERQTSSRKSTLAAEPAKKFAIQESTEDIDYIIETETGAEDSGYAPRQVVFPRTTSMESADIMILPSATIDSETDYSSSTPRRALQMS